MVTYVDDYTALVSGRSWSGTDGVPAVVTYSFETVAPAYLADESDVTQAFIDSFQSFTATQQTLTRQALAEWAAASGIIFVEVAAGDGDMRFGNYDFSLNPTAAGFGGYAYYPSRDVFDWNTWESPIGGDVFINTARMSNMSYSLITHEIGHAIGLEHPHDGDVRLQAAYDNGTYTVMSYNGTSGNAGLGLFDYDATQVIYGPAVFVPSQNGGIEAFAFDEARGLVTQGWGSADSDILGSSLRDDIDAGSGNDRVGGFKGNDTLIGGAGNDMVFGGAGHDLLIGGAGDDRYVGGDAWDDANGGSDTVSYAPASADLTITLGPRQWNGTTWANAWSSETGNDEFWEIDHVIGGSGHDDIGGNEDGNRLEGGAGDDTLDGGDGDDTLDGGAGGDTFIGGEGRDTVTYESATRSVRVDLQNPAFLFNDAVGDTFDGIEVFQTGNTIDQLRGNAQGNEFYTGGLSDRLYGRAGDDLLFGEAGADAFYGGVGADTMTGGDDAGRRDRFIYFNIVESGVGVGNRDVITDFVSGEDRIEISRFDADITQGLKQRFDFIGDAAFSNAAVELRYEQTGGITVVQADVNGDSLADFEIELRGLIDLLADDFLL